MKKVYLDGIRTQGRRRKVWKVQMNPMSYIKCNQVLISYITFLKNGPSSVSFLFISFFSNKLYKFYRKLMWKNVHPVFRAGNWNPQPSDHESSPITTRPGLFELGNIFKPRRWYLSNYKHRLFMLPWAPWTFNSAQTELSILLVVIFSISINFISLPMHIQSPIF